MRVECGSCKRVADGRFALAEGGGALAVTCTACGATTRAELAASPASDAPAVALEDLCPKCGAVRKPDSAACASCGLATERMAGFAESRDAAVSDSVRVGWVTVQAGWDEPARHDAFLLLVAQHDAYAWAAGRYRDASRARPADAVAPRQLERVRRAGEATLFAAAAARPDKSATPYRAVIAVFGMLLIAVVAGLLYAFVLDNDTTPAPPIPGQVR